MTATALRGSPRSFAAWAMPSAAEIDVDECAVPKVSNSLSSRLGKPEMPPNWRSVDIASRRPVNTLCGYVWCPTSHTMRSYGVLNT